MKTNVIQAQASELSKQERIDMTLAIVFIAIWTLKAFGQVFYHNP